MDEYCGAGCVRVAAVLVVLHGAHDLGHEHRVERAAGEQDVEAVRHGRGHREHVGLTRRGAEEPRRHHGPYEPEDPRQDRAGSHDGCR